MWKTQVAVFTMALAWDWVSVWSTRAYANQSWASLPLSAVLMGLWIGGVTLSMHRRYWPALILGAVAGTAIGISFL